MNGNSDEIQRAYLDRFAIEWRHVDSCDATTECELFGRKLATPVMCGGMAHYERMNEGGRVAFAEGLSNVNSGELVVSTKVAEDDKAAVTDDCSAVEAMGVKVTVVAGERSNIKLTSVQDVYLAERILAERGTGI